MNTDLAGGVFCEIISTEIYMGSLVAARVCFFSGQKENDKLGNINKRIAVLAFAF